MSFGPRGSMIVSFDLVGEWLSLVEHLVRDQGVGGSNPLSPTNSNQSHLRGISPGANFIPSTLFGKAFSDVFFLFATIIRQIISREMLPESPRPPWRPARIVLHHGGYLWTKSRSWNCLLHRKDQCRRWTRQEEPHGKAKGSLRGTIRRGCVLWRVVAYRMRTSGNWLPRNHIGYGVPSKHALKPSKYYRTLIEMHDYQIADMDGVPCSRR